MLHIMNLRKMERELKKFQTALERKNEEDIIKSTLSILSYDQNGRIFGLTQSLFRSLRTSMIDFIEAKKAAAFNDVLKTNNISKSLSVVYHKLHLKYCLDSIKFGDDLSTAYLTILSKFAIRKSQFALLKQYKAFIEILDFLIKGTFDENKATYMLQSLSLEYSDYQNIKNAFEKKDVKTAGKEIQIHLKSKLANAGITLDTDIFEYLRKSYLEDTTLSKTMYQLSVQYANDIVYKAINEAIEKNDTLIYTTIIELLDGAITVTPRAAFDEILENNPDLFSDYYDIIKLLCCPYFTAESYAGVKVKELKELILTIAQIITKTLITMDSLAKNEFEAVVFAGIHLEINKLTIAIDLEVNMLKALNAYKTYHSMMLYEKCYHWQKEHENLMEAKEAKPIQDIILSSLGIQANSTLEENETSESKALFNKFFDLISEYLIKYYVDMPEELFNEFLLFYKENEF